MNQNISPDLDSILGQLDSLGISAKPYGDSGQLQVNFYDTGFPFSTADVLCMLPCLNPSTVFESTEEIAGQRARKVHFLISATELSYKQSIEGMKKFIKNANERLDSQANSERR